MSRERFSIVVLVVLGLLAAGLWLARKPHSGDLPRANLGLLSEPARQDVTGAMAAVDTGEREAGALGVLCLTYYSYGLPAASADCYARAAAWDPGTPGWIYSQGVAHQGAGEIGEARAAFERLLARDPAHHASLLRLGYLLLETDLDRAAQLFERSIAIDPGDPRSHYGLGVARRVAGDRHAALENFRRAIAIDPGHAQAHYAIAMILVAGGDVVSARSHLRLHARGTPLPLTDDIPGR